MLTSVSNFPSLVILLEEEKKVCSYCKEISFDYYVEHESECLQKIEDYLKTRDDIFPPPYKLYITKAKDRKFDGRLHIEVRHKDNHADCRNYDIQIERKIYGINPFQESDIDENSDDDFLLI